MTMTDLLIGRNEIICVLRNQHQKEKGERARDNAMRDLERLKYNVSHLVQEEMPSYVDTQRNKRGASRE